MVPISREDMYPQMVGEPIQIKTMSEGCIKNQLEKIEATDINIQYKEIFKAELKIRFNESIIPLLD